MLYDGFSRRVSFWEGGAMEGEPRTVIDDLPAVAMLPFVGVYENSATVVEQYWPSGAGA
jgi:hypothetical protein